MLGFGLTACGAGDTEANNGKSQIRIGTLKYFAGVLDELAPFLDRETLEALLG